MRLVELYLYEKDEIFKCVEINEDVDLWDQPMKIDDEWYCVEYSKGNKYYISKLIHYNAEASKTNRRDNITCPICTRQVPDSWDYDSDCGEHICDYCGTVLEWERNIEVSYTATVKEKVDPIEF